MELLSTILLMNRRLSKSKIYYNPTIHKIRYNEKIKLYPKYQPKKRKRIDKINNVSATNNMKMN